MMDPVSFVVRCRCMLVYEARGDWERWFGA